MEVGDDLPSHTKYWLTATSKNDCFFVLGPESGHTERIGAIKVLLFAYSEPLRNMLDNSELAERGDVRVVDIEPGTFWNFMKCVYGGSNIVIPKLSFCESVNLLYVVEKYLVAEIKPKVVAHILHLFPTDFDNIFCAISNPVCFSDKKIGELTMEILETKMDRVVSSKKFLQLSAEALLLIVKTDCLNINEPSVWDAVVKWAKYTTNSNDGKVLRKQILPHLKFIRFCTFTCEEFCEKVVSTGILTCEEVNEVCKFFCTGNTSLLKSVSDSIDPRYKIEARKTFFYTVNDIKNLPRVQESPKVFFQNYSWNVLLNKNADKLGVFLKCGGNSTNSSWMIPLYFELILLNQQDKPNLSKCLTHTFFTGESDWGFSSFYSWNQLMDISNGFLKDNTIIVMVHMKVEPE
uniref:MATH domain-containing protein n=1 Tax=Cuerna arida TaxID=1464854 RepID=A0A1B6EWY2_9HEMI